MFILRRTFFMLALGFALVSTGACQNHSNEQLLGLVWELAAERHYDRELHGLDWNAVRDHYEPSVANANQRSDALALIDRMLQELGDSHCAVGELANAVKASSPYLFASGQTGLDLRLLDGQAVVTDVQPGSPAEQAGIRPGEVITVIDGQPVATIIKTAPLRPPYTEANIRFHQTQAVLWSLYGEPDTELSLGLLNAAGEPRMADLVRTGRPETAQTISGMRGVHLSHETRTLSGNVEYLRFNAFQPDDPAELLAILDDLDKSAPLVIDLRGNNGGSVAATLALLGRFMPQRTLVFVREGRDDSERYFVERAAPHHSGPVAVLVDELSISAAENFAGVMQHTGRARIIGARTPGQLLWGEGYEVTEDIVAVIPVAEIIYPDGSSLEAIGVTPDLLVHQSRAGLANGVDAQLRAAIHDLKN